MFGSSRFRAGLLSVLVGDRAIARRSMSAIGLPRNGQGWCQGGLSGAAVRTASPRQVVFGNGFGSMSPYQHQQVCQVVS